MEGAIALLVGIPAIIAFLVVYLIDQQTGLKELKSVGTVIVTAGVSLFLLSLFGIWQDMLLDFTGLLLSVMLIAVTPLGMIIQRRILLRREYRSERA